MQTHPLVILSPGPAWKENLVVRAQLLADHARYPSDRLREQDKLGAAGPFEAPDALAGLLIFKSIPLAEAQDLLEAVHAIQAGILKAEFHTGGGDGSGFHPVHPTGGLYNLRPIA